MKWRNYAALLEIGASPIEVDAPPSHSLFVSSSCFPLLINKRIFVRWVLLREVAQAV